MNITDTLDRLLHNSHVISLKGDSYRMKDRIKIGVVDFKIKYAEVCNFIPVLTPVPSNGR
jgi:hypothetical protein